MFKCDSWLVKKTSDSNMNYIYIYNKNMRFEKWPLNTQNLIF